MVFTDHSSLMVELWLFTDGLMMVNDSNDGCLIVVKRQGIKRKTSGLMMVHIVIANSSEPSEKMVKLVTNQMVKYGEPRMVGVTGYGQYGLIWRHTQSQ